jgi:hypothetical protein
MAPLRLSSMKPSRSDRQWSLNAPIVSRSSRPGWVIDLGLHVARRRQDPRSGSSAVRGPEFKRHSRTLAQPNVLALPPTERGALGLTTHLCPSSPSASSTRAADGGAACVASRRKRGGLVSPRAVPRFHRDRRHPSSPGRGRDRSCDDDDKEPYPCHNRGTNACSAGRDRKGGRDGDRCLLVEKMGDRACSFPGLRVGLDDPQEDHPGPRGPLQNVDSLLQARRIPCFRLLSRRQLALAQQRERQDPGDLAVERPPAPNVSTTKTLCGDEAERGGTERVMFT